MNAFDGRTGANLQRALMVGAWVLVALLILLVAYVVQSLRYVGAGIQASNTVQVSGTGDAYAVPDVGQFSYSVVSDQTTVKAAQDDATAKANAITAYLKQAGIDDKDIKTTDYSVTPRYEYSNGVCSNGYCPPSKQTLIGYEVSQTTQVKVRDTSKAGDLLAGVGGKGATNISGLTFTTEDPTAVQTEARDKAIADAKAKATKLASELGVSLVRVTAFSENQGGGPIPLAYGKGAGPAAESAAVAPDISIGQNKVTDDVTITYEIR